VLRWQRIARGREGVSGRDDYDNATLAAMPAGVDPNYRFRSRREIRACFRWITWDDAFMYWRRGFTYGDMVENQNILPRWMDPHKPIYSPVLDVISWPIHFAMAILVYGGMATGVGATALWDLGVLMCAVGVGALKLLFTAYLWVSAAVIGYKLTRALGRR
jgi:hypothetical protein